MILVDTINVYVPIGFWALSWIDVIDVAASTKTVRDLSRAAYTAEQLHLGRFSSSCDHLLHHYYGGTSFSLSEDMNRLQGLSMTK